MKLFLQRILLFSVIVCVVAVACSKEHSVDTGKRPPAHGTLKDANGNCLNQAVYGTFYNGVKAKDSNYVEIAVNVTVAGSYTVATDVNNGVSFSASGIFSDTGIHIIRLIPTGVFSTHESTLFNVSFDTAAPCVFDIDVQDSTGKNLGGDNGTTNPVGANQYQFTLNNKVYSGSINVATIEDVTYPGATAQKGLVITGINAAMDSAFIITIATPGSKITSGTYTTADASKINLFSIGKGDASNPTNGSGYIAAFSTKGVISTILTYNSTTRIVSGTFSGTAVPVNGGTAGSTTVAVTNGSFSATVQ
ncbi:hypothetical protein [Deminuibacter soli]|uniref:Lipoprotein n=1 Tax=Deminuibacter soli TaxID=2291815 RepID=A0A3E1NI57_9BACT|nr:hypothetical protein [Deminuibacter soli]RFM27468.1 hypothetical protein DXN05_15750 [Deminuibacter soli]